MRSDGIPCYVSPGDTATALNPVRLDEKEIREGFLQRMLHEHLDLLPIAKLHEAFAPLAALGRKIRDMDNLFVSAEALGPTLEQAAAVFQVSSLSYYAWESGETIPLEVTQEGALARLENTSRE